MRLLPLLFLLAVPSFAQKKWTAIGTTASGNKVYLDAKSVKRTGALVEATVRVVFTEPVKTPTGTWMSTRTRATFDCAQKKLAAKENVVFGDAKETKVIERKVNKVPGYGAIIAGSLGDVALKYLCSGK